VKRDLRPVEDAQQLGLSSMKPPQLMARQSGWEPRVNQDEKRRPGGLMIVADGCHLQDLIDACGSG
jgi:hypothetical protein